MSNGIHDPKKQVYGMEKPSTRILSEEELAWMEGRSVPKPMKRAKEEITLEDNDIVMPDETGGYIPVQPKQKVIYTPEKKDDNTIVVNNANKKVEVRFETSAPKPDGSSKPVVFSVTVNNAAVDITEDGISILMKNDLEIKPPTLIPMTIIMDSGIQYSVVYAGGKHRLGNFTNISFARIGDE